MTFCIEYRQSMVKKREEGKNELLPLFSLLHKKTKIDFAQYKATTMKRRIQRRMTFKNIESYKTYLSYLQKNPAEVLALEEDLLITVTSFFRDPEKFTVLEKIVFPSLVKKRKAADPLRIWVPGCSTGEEVYSLAIALTEFLEKKGLAIQFQIFATDVKNSTLQKARLGLYPQTISNTISPQRLKRFFTKMEGGYQIKKEIQEHCLFALHDVTQNPAFSNLDLISCQNVLIYLEQDVQKKILSSFSFALNTNGFLVLGHSESIGAEKKLFHTVDTKQKIYSKNKNTSPVLQAAGFANLNLPKPSQSKSKAKKVIANPASRLEKIQNLKEALELTQEYAGTIISEFDTLTEELQSTNEELLVNNEEFQTANEELETSEEELQAANEELLALNTELQKREAEKSRLAAIVESSDDAIISKNIDGIITTWNKGAERLYGYSAQEIIGKSVVVLMPPNKKNDFPKIMQLLRQGKRVEHYETQRMTKDKRILTVSLTVSPLKDAQGRIIGASKIARDITERKNLENNLLFFSHASKTLASSLDYKTTLSNVAKLAIPYMADWCGVDLLNDNGELEQVAVVHKDPEKVKWAIQLRAIYPPDMDAPSGVPNVLRTGKPEFYPLITNEMLVAAAKDEKHLKIMKSLGFVSAIVVPLNKRGKTIGAITFVTNETGRRYTNADLTIAEELANRVSMAIENADLYQTARQAVTLRDNFISIASHELKTPVTSLKIYTQLLQRKFAKQGDKTTSDQLMKMDHQIDSLNKLVRDLLDVARLEKGELDFQQEEFDLHELVAETIENLQTTTTKHTIILQDKAKIHVLGDRFRINQVLVNLLTNAIKYSPKADKIIVRLKQENKTAVVQIEDFGIGIEKKYQQDVFKRFYRVNDVLEKTFPGLGIGLYISHEIIRRHGGTISIKSNKGKGSVFSFTIPMRN
jgi:PAS domain S-box-containing protein